MGTDSESVCYPDPRIGGIVVGDDAEPQSGVVPADRPGVRHVPCRDGQPRTRLYEAEWELEGGRS